MGNAEMGSVPTTSDDLPIAIEFTMTHAEVAVAWRWRYLRSRDFLHSAFLVIMLLSVGVLLPLITDGHVDHPLSLGAIAVAIVLVGLVLNSLFRLPDQAWRKDAAVRGRQALWFGSAHFEMATDLGRDERPWSVIKATREAEGFYLFDYVV